MRFNTKNLIDQADRVELRRAQNPAPTFAVTDKLRFENSEGETFWNLAFETGPTELIPDQFVNIQPVNGQAVVYDLLGNNVLLTFSMNKGGMPRLAERIKSLTSGVPLEQARTWSHLRENGERCVVTKAARHVALHRETPGRPLMDLISLAVRETEANLNALARGTEYRQALEQAATMILTLAEGQPLPGKLTFHSVKPVKEDQAFEINFVHEWHEVRITGRHYYRQSITLVAR